MGEEYKYIGLRPFKLNVDFRAQPEKLQSYVNAPPGYQFRFSGIAGNRSLETVPMFAQTPSEVVWTNERNAWIVLGIDREKGITSGKGGKGQTQCGAIDLVAGRMASYARGHDDEGNPIKVNPDFVIDSARVYISQKSDIDEYFHLVDGKVGNPSAASAVGIKADEVRLVARGGIKLVTGTDMRDSQGDRIFESKGVDLIAGNDDSDMQPLVKGDNLVFGLLDMAAEIEQLREILFKFMEIQHNYNEKLFTHTHKSPFYGVDTLFDVGPAFGQGAKTLVDVLDTMIRGIVTHQTTFSTWQNDYLSPFGHSFICSKRNHTN